MTDNAWTLGPLDPDPLRPADTDRDLLLAEAFEAGWEEGYRFGPSMGPAIAFGLIVGLLVGVGLGLAAAWRA